MGKIIVVGAGISGLSCASRLCQSGLEFSLFEAAPAIGGRTRDFYYRGVELDNGQHLMLDIYHRTQALLDLVEAPGDSFVRRPFNWTMLEPVAGSNNDPSPDWRVHRCGNREGLKKMLAQWALLAGGRGLKSRWSVYAGLLRLWWAPAPKADDTAGEWLSSRGQGSAIVRRLWGPLCLAALNTPINRASARSFYSILKRILPRGHRLNFLFNRRPLGQALVEPCRDFLLKHNIAIQHGNRVTEVLIDARKGVRGVRTRDGKRHDADEVVLAIPPWACVAALGEHRTRDVATSRLLDTLASFRSAPINTRYLQFERSLNGREDMIGLLEHEFDWIIDRERVCQQTGLLALVTSARAHTQTIEPILATLTRVYGALPKLLWTKNVLEKKATIECTPERFGRRPPSQTPIRGLRLCGDWIRHPLPCTIETAVDIGWRCADDLILAR